MYVDSGFYYVIDKFFAFSYDIRKLSGQVSVLYKKVLKKRIVLFFFSADESDFSGGKLHSHGYFYEDSLLQFLFDKFPDHTGDAETNLGKLY